MKRASAAESPAARDYGFAGRVGRACEWLDEHLPHRFMWVPGRRLICSAADTSYGWNPEAIDWEEKATWLDRWIDRNRLCRDL